MAKIIRGQSIYNPFEYDDEEEFEKDVIEHVEPIFGSGVVYFNVKKRIAKQNIITIPDGYLVDFSFQDNPRLYIIENELVIHDPYKHIGQQLLKFAVAYKNAGREIKSYLLEKISNNDNKKETLDNYLQNSKYRNIDALLEDIIFNKPIGVIVIIDEITDDLSNVLNQLNIKSDILEFQKYINQNDSSDIIYQFTPFQQDIKSLEPVLRTTIDLERLDTIVVPANEDGFQSVFLGENCWYAIRISSIMIDKIRYIAGYQTAPISAITHIAEVEKIEKYQNTDKYIVYFKGKAEKIEPIKLVPKSRVKAPQAPRYTTYRKLKEAKNLDEVF